MRGGLLICGLIALTVSGCGGSSNQPLGSGATTTTPTVAQGSPFDSGGLSVTITDLYGLATIGDADSPIGYHVPRGKEWIIIKTHVANMGNTPGHFDTDDERLVVDGKQYMPDSSAARDVDGGSQTSAVLNPGLSDDLVAAYDVPPHTFPPKQAGVFVVANAGIGSPETSVKLTGTSSPSPSSSSTPPTP